LKYRVLFVGQRELDRDVLAQNPVDVDLAVVAQEVEVVLADAAELLAPRMP